MKAKKTRMKRASVEIEETSYIPGIMAQIQELLQNEVLIGMSAEDEETAIAGAVNEFGSAKMGIPARSFIRASRNKINIAVTKIAKERLKKLGSASLNVPQMFREIGEAGQEKMLAGFDKVNGPALTPIYAKRKGNSKLLVDTDKLRNSITFEVTTRQTYKPKFWSKPPRKARRRR